MKKDRIFKKWNESRHLVSKESRRPKASRWKGMHHQNSINILCTVQRCFLTSGPHTRIQGITRRKDKMLKWKRGLLPWQTRVSFLSISKFKKARAKIRKPKAANWKCVYTAIEINSIMRKRPGPNTERRTDKRRWKASMNEQTQKGTVSGTVCRPLQHRGQQWQFCFVQINTLSTNSIMNFKIPVLKILNLRAMKKKRETSGRRTLQAQ